MRYLILGVGSAGLLAPAGVAWALGRLTGTAVLAVPGILRPTA
jgi:hypothetical protein